MSLVDKMGVHLTEEEREKDSHSANSIVITPKTNYISCLHVGVGIRYALYMPRGNIYNPSPNREPLSGPLCLDTTDASQV